MEKTELAPHVKEVARALNGKKSEQEIEKELSDCLDTYGLTIGQAKRTVVTRHGGDPSALSSGLKKTVVDVKGDERSLDMVARVVAVAKRTITVKGSPKEVVTGILGDNSGTIPFTSWDGKLQLEKGAVVEVRNAYAKFYRDEPQLNFGDRTTVNVLPADAMPPYQPEPKSKKLIDLRMGDRNLTVRAKVLEPSSREVVNPDGVKKTLTSGMLADETARVPFAAWADFGLRDGDGIEISNAYVKRWRGSPQLVFDENSKVSKAKGLPEVVNVESQEPLAMDVLSKRGGGSDVSIQGAVVEVREAGVVYRCPECRRVIKDASGCKLHGEVDSTPDLRVKGILDDGKGAVTFFLDRPTIERLFGITLDMALEEERKKPGQFPMTRKITEALITKTLQLQGNVTEEEYGLTMIVQRAEMPKLDLEADARKLLDSMEGYL